MARNRSIAQRLEARRHSKTAPDLHQERFIKTLRGSSDFRKLSGSSAGLYRGGEIDVTLKHPSLPYYRFEGVQALDRWSISDNKNAWPLMDELREMVEAYERELERRKKARHMKRDILAKASEIQFISERIIERPVAQPDYAY